MNGCSFFATLETIIRGGKGEEKSAHEERKKRIEWGEGEESSENI